MANERLMTITDHKMVVDHIDAQPLPEVERKKLAARFDELLYETLMAGHKFAEPGALTWPPKAKPVGCPECHGIVLHRSDCKIGFAIT